jgi:hypothetical protein
MSPDELKINFEKEIVLFRYMLRNLIVYAAIHRRIPTVD